MKIAFIGQKGIPATFGGVETHVERLAVGLSRLRHQVFVYCRPWYTRRQPSFYKGVKLLYKSSIKTKNLDTISHVFLSSIDACRRNFDIIHYHGVGPSLLAWIPRLLCPATRVVITFHSIDRTHQKWGRLARFFLWLGEVCALKFAHETIVVSRMIQNYVMDRYNAQTLYIPNGIDKQKKQKARDITTAFGLVEKDYLMFLSRLIPHKGVHYLIDAYEKINTRKKLVIVGRGMYTDNYVKSVVDRIKNNKHIMLLDDISMGSQLWRELYSNAYLFVHPSESEGLPIVILEAMSFGTCPLVSDIPENLEAISGGYGFQFKNKSVLSLKNKMQYLLQHPGLVKHVGERAREHVEKNYNWKDIITQIDRVYDCVFRVKGQDRLNACLRRINKVDF